MQIKNKSKVKIETLSLNHEIIDKKSVFIALKGHRVDATQFINEALLEKVGAVFTYKEMNLKKCIFIPQLAFRLSEMVSILYPHLFKNSTIIGICGTCGKTTTATMIYHILKEHQKSVICFGTGKIYYDNQEINTNNTTLNPIDFVHYYLQIAKHFDYIVMEVSSHAILENRIDFLNFDFLVFTNFSQDHLDYHLNMNNYFQVKQALFKSLSKKSYAIINLEDAKAFDLMAQIPSNIVTYGLKQGKYTLKDYHRAAMFEYNQYNLLAAYTTAQMLKLNPSKIKQALDQYEFKYGRSQWVYDQKFKVALDYAHTPAALYALLKASRKQCKNRLIVIFGCGGNRDQTKREKMGKIAQQFADLIILTNDNPRQENPQNILKEIQKGCPKARIIEQRKAAIFYGIQQAKEEDMVLVIGKGNENYQWIQNEKIPFSDLACIEESVSHLE